MGSAARWFARSLLAWAVICAASAAMADGNKPAATGDDLPAWLERPSQYNSQEEKPVADFVGGVAGLDCTNPAIFLRFLSLYRVLRRQIADDATTIFATQQSKESSGKKDPARSDGALVLGLETGFFNRTDQAMVRLSQKPTCPADQGAAPAPGGPSLPDRKAACQACEPLASVLNAVMALTTGSEDDDVRSVIPAAIGGYSGALARCERSCPGQPAPAPPKEAAATALKETDATAKAPAAPAAPVSDTKTGPPPNRFTIRFDDRRPALAPEGVHALAAAVAAARAGGKIEIEIYGCGALADFSNGSVCARRKLTVAQLLAARGVQHPDSLFTDTGPPVNPHP